MSLCLLLFNTKKFGMCEGGGENSWKWFVDPCRLVFERYTHCVNLLMGEPYQTSCNRGQEFFQTFSWESAELISTPFIWVHSMWSSSSQSDSLALTSHSQITNYMYYYNYCNKKNNINNKQLTDEVLLTGHKMHGQACSERLVASLNFHLFTKLC